MNVDMGISNPSQHHYKNIQFQYIEYLIDLLKLKKKKKDILLVFSQNIDCGYNLEPPRRGISNEYLQSMFWTKKRILFFKC